MLGEGQVTGMVRAFAYSQMEDRNVCSLSGYLCGSTGDCVQAFLCEYGQGGQRGMCGLAKEAREASWL